MKGEEGEAALQESLRFELQLLFSSFHHLMMDFLHLPS
jgi:hypothetical protein